MIALLAGLAPVQVLAGANEQVDVSGLAGTLQMPDASGVYPGALIIAGSGPTDRDGNSRLGLNTDSYKLLAEGLAARGIASLRYDKRGIGGSALSGRTEPETRIGDFANDAALLADWLRKRPGISSVSLIGHSEGALIALLAAKRVRPAGLVLLAAPGRRFGAIFREQFSRPGLGRDVTTEALAIISALERGETVAKVSQILAPAFRPSVQPYLRSLLALDPADLARRTNAPLFVIGGGRDLQIGKSDFDDLLAACPKAVAYWDPDMGHTLKPMRGDAQSLRAAYTDPHLALSPGLAGRVADFIEQSDHGAPQVTR